MTYKHIQLRALFVLAAATAASCSLPSDDLDLDVATQDADEEMTRRLNVRVIPENPSPYFPPTGTDPNTFVDAIYTDCELSAGGSSLCAGSTCDGRRCRVERSLCVAHQLLTVVRQVADSEITAAGVYVNAGTLTVPAQDEPTKFILSSNAYYYATDALRWSGDALGGTCSASDLDVLWQSEHARSVFFATAYGESFEVATEAIDALQRSSSAVIASYYSEHAQVNEAARLALTSEVVSRQIVARFLAGGDELGMVGVDDGFCPFGRRSSEVQRAIEIIREVAPQPVKIFSDDPIDAFVSNQLSYPLSVLYGDPQLEEDPDRVYARFGVSAEAFLHAREYFRGEIRGFDRDFVHAATELALPGGETSATYFQRYASTSTPPRVPSDDYFGAVSSFSRTVHFPVSSSTEQTVPYGGWFDWGYFPSFAAAVDGYVTGATQILARTDTQLGASSATVRSVLGGLLADANTLRPGRIDGYYWESGTDQYVYIRVFGAPAAENLLLVRGHAGLQCATRGTVEGAPCEVSEYSDTGFAFASAASSAATTGFLSHANRWVQLSGQPQSTHVPNASQLFVVVRRSGTEGAAGDYDEFGGFMINQPTPSGGTQYRFAIHVPVVPDVQRRLAETLALSPEHCGDPATSCAGVPWDQLLPLENELTSDGDAVESSWRHYLTLARQAADHADTLGEEVIRAGLDMDLRAEGAIDELEQLCGVSLNVTSFGDLLSLPRTVPLGSGCDAEMGYRAEGSDCVLDPILLALSMAASEPDAQRLAACLGGDATEPWVTVGNRPLCIWQSGTNEYCGDARDGYACPYEGVSTGPSTASCPDQRPPGVTGDVITVPVRLGLFHEPDPTELGPNPTRLNPDELPCAEIAEARATGGAVAASPFLNVSRIAEYASRLNWSAGVGDYSTVLWDNGTLHRTGSATASTPYAGWPCAPAPTCAEQMMQANCEAYSGCTWTTSCTGTVDNPQCPGAYNPEPAGYDGPLFCLANVCGGDQWARTNRIRRARMNDLLARAVMAARLLGGQSLEGMRVPFYMRTNDDDPRVAEPPGWNAPVDVLPVLTGYTHQRSEAGVLHVGDCCGGDWDVVDVNFSDLPAIAERLNGAADAWVTEPTFMPPSNLRSVEWSACPYDRLDGCTEFFDDQPDFDDLPAAQHFDRDMPFLSRVLPDATAGYDPGTGAGRLWDREIATLLQRPHERQSARVLGATDAVFDGDPWTDLSMYWRRSGCGIFGGGNCDAGLEGRSPYEDETVRYQQRICWSNSGVLSGGLTIGCETIGCGASGRDRFYQCRADAAVHGIDFESTFDGNRAFIAPHGLTGTDFLNGLELLCDAAQRSSPDSGLGCPPGPPTVNSVVDMYRLEAFLRCKAARIRSAAASGIIRDVPVRVVEILQRQGAGGIHGDVVGEYGSATDELAAAYAELRDSEETIAGTIDDLANQIDAVQNAIAQSGIASDIEDLQLVSQVANQITQCVVAAANLVSASGEDSATAAAGAGLSMAATCVNSGIQIGLAVAIRDLRVRGIELQNEAAFINFDTQFNALSRSLTTQATAIQAALLRISAAQGRLATLREQGRRAVARALFFDAEPTGRQFAVNTVMRRRYSTALHRYHEAHTRAVRLTFIAKLALEQRLGMTLDSMTDELLTVEAPSTWQGRLCELPTIDYDRVRSVMTTDAGEAVEEPEGYSGAYVGDYVRRLEQVFESYNFAYPFADGTDVAVLSLRDDIRGIRAECEVEVPNLLYQAGHLDMRATEEQGGWYPENCATLPPQVIANPPAWWAPPDYELPAYEPTPEPACVAATPLDDSALAPGVARWGSSAGTRVEFGLPTTGTSDLREALTLDSRLAQWLHLNPGRYRVSWYGRSTPGAGGAAILPMSAVHFRQSTESSETDLRPSDTYVFSSTDTAATGWTRYWFFADLSIESDVVVAVEPGYTSSTPYRVVDLAALMVEDVSRTMLDSPTASIGGGAYLGSIRGPGPFFDTTEARVRSLPVCEDTSGTIFRRDGWTYGCVNVCPDGYDGTCGDAGGRRCYWQTSLGVSSDALQQLAASSPAGFAAGNFNYRMESIGLNLVGTGLRDCGGAGGVAGCYASGNIAYSLFHDGPYPVRNARGEIYDAPLFRGRIESARALAAERYLSNPVSSADRGLIEPYVRHEFRGRPLGGSLVLRIWDDGGFVFDRLEDVQIVLGYRYWQHQR